MLPNLVAAFHSTPWALHPAKLVEIRNVLHAKLRGETEYAAQFARTRPRESDNAVQMYGRVAVVQVFGTIAQRFSGFASGGVSAEELGATLQGLAADASVKTIVMQLDSPGGSVFGLEELSKTIANITKEKTIIAQVDPFAASAAYWIASQASEIVVTPSGQVGSIGVITVHDDMSKAMETAGIKSTYITSSAYKAEGNSDNPLSPEAMAEMQSKVNKYHADFVNAVARGRGTTQTRVETLYGQGRMVTAKDALESGMVDRIATMQQTLARLGATGGDGRRASAESLDSVRVTAWKNKNATG